MKLKVENGRLIVSETNYEHKLMNKGLTNERWEDKEYEEEVANIDIKELAKLLKPYLDAIPNHECKGCKK